MLLTGIGDDVEGRHDQARAVTDDADFAVELDVVQTRLLGLGLQRVGSALVLELFVLGVAHLARVVIEGDLAIEGDDVAVAVEDERVDLDEGRALAGVDVVELHEGIRDLVHELRGEASSGRDLDSLVLVDTGQRVHLDAGQGLGLLHRELLNLHATFDGAQRQVGAVRAVQQHGEVELLLDRSTGCDHDPVDDMTLDVQPQDRFRCLVGFVRVLRDLHAAGLAATSGLDLSFDDHDTADLLGSRLRLLRSVGDDAGEHRHPVLLE